MKNTRLLKALKKGPRLASPFLFFLIVSCVNPQPSREEYNLAVTALRSARDSEAKRYAPKVYTTARRYFRRAERSFKEKYYSDATDYFRKSRYYAEKAENIARVKMFKQGDMAQ